jgi:hypothetical protein
VTDHGSLEQPDRVFGCRGSEAGFSMLSSGSPREELGAVRGHPRSMRLRHGAN